ncbi:MAG TPA: alpha/beta fold hydrolase [Rhodothermales bacterium]|nr:alpha/beta fold hydrolase [Rhodothermales bacterium]
MKQPLLILSFLFPFFSMAQPGAIPPNVFPKEAFTFKNIQKTPCNCDPNYPNTPWVCDAYDYEMTPGYDKLQRSIYLGPDRPNCWDKLVLFHYTNPNTQTVYIRFVQPETGWPSSSVMYYYYPDEIVFSWWEEREGAQILLDEKKFNNPFTQSGFSEDTILQPKLKINGNSNKSIFKINSNANIKNLRLFYGAIPYRNDFMYDIDSGTLKLIKESDHEIIYEYTHPIKAHPNIKNYFFSIADNSAIIPANPPYPEQPFWLYSVYFIHETPSIKLSIIQEQNGVEKIINTTEFNQQSEFNEILKTKIATDASTSTLIRISSEEPIDHLKLRIISLPKSSATNTDKEIMGELKVEKSTPKEVTYRYIHPSFIDPAIKDLALDLYSEASGYETSIYQPIFKLTPPPTLLLHGLWSNGSIWIDLPQRLATTGHNLRLVRRVTYPNGASFKDNAFVLRSNIDVLLTTALFQNVLATKVNVVAHSMGGLLARQYIQNANFKKDINKLITLNTPHSGSQIANIIDSDQSLKFFLGFVLSIPKEGALENLRVNSTAIKALNQNPTQNMNEVLVHGIVSEKPFDNSWISKKVESIASQTALLKLCSDVNATEVDFNRCLREKVFKEPNDWIVGISSQGGGLPLANTTYFSGINHMEAHTAPAVIQRVTDLLNEKNSSSSFSRAGYNPVVLAPPDGFNQTLSKKTTGGIKITYPIRDQQIRTSSTLNVNVEGSSDIKNLLFAFASDSLGVNSQILLNASKGSFPIVIPDKLNQPLKLLIIGFDATGGIVGDTLTVQISSSVSSNFEAPPKENQFTVAPNPFQNKIEVQWDKTLEGELTLYDVLGREVWSQKVSGERINTDLSFLGAGIYFLRLEYDGRFHVVKITKKE